MNKQSVPSPPDRSSNPRLHSQSMKVIFPIIDCVQVAFPSHPPLLIEQSCALMVVISIENETSNWDADILSLLYNGGNIEVVK